MNPLRRSLFALGTIAVLVGLARPVLVSAAGQDGRQILEMAGVPVGYAVQQYAATFRDGGANAGDGYVIAAGETQSQETDTKLFALQARDYRWRVRVAMRPVAMALAGDKLLVAGPPDRQDPAESLAALEGRQGGVLLVLSAADGKVLSESTLATPPVFDGLAVAQKRRYVSTTDGKVICLAD
jgi:hypothetical protein